MWSWERGKVDSGSALVGRQRRVHDIWIGLRNVDILRRMTFVKYLMLFRHASQTQVVQLCFKSLLSIVNVIFVLRSYVTFPVLIEII